MDRPRRSLFFMALTLMFSLAGCGGDNEVSLDPPDVKYNEDISEMGMFVVDPRFTVAYLPDDGDWILFDDLGEMFRYRVMRYPNDNVRVIWVNDFHGKDWLNVEVAWFLQSPQINTPMGWGIAAFRDESAARKLQSELGGELMSWSEVQNRQWTGPPTPVPHAHGTPTPLAVTLMDRVS